MSGTEFFRGILEKQYSGMKRAVEGERLPEEGNSNKKISQVRSDKSSGDEGPIFDVHCMHGADRLVARLSVLHYSSMALLVYRTPSYVETALF